MRLFSFYSWWKKMDVTGTNTDWVSGLVLGLLPQEMGSLHLFSQGHVTQKRGGQAMSQWPCCLRAPTCPWWIPRHPEIRTVQLCFCNHEVVWPAAMGEFFFFPSMFAV